MKRIALNPRLHDGAPQAPSFSQIIFGCWRMADAGQDTSPKTILARIERCLDLGITTFDHADIYGGYAVEEVFGAALALRPSLRERMEIITKCGIKLVSPARPQHALKTYDTRAAHIIGSVENSLSKLRVDCIDLLLLHRPDPLLNPHEVADAFTKLADSGKVRAFGVSNFLPHQVEMLQSFLKGPLLANQIEMNCLRTAPLYDGTLDQCLRLSMRPLAWSPIAGGALADENSSNPAVGRVRAALAKLEAKYEVGIEALAIAWLQTHPSGVLPIVGTQNDARLARLARAADLMLEQDDWFAVLEAAEGKGVP